MYNQIPFALDTSDPSDDKLVLAKEDVRALKKAYSVVVHAEPSGRPYERQHGYLTVWTDNSLRESRDIPCIVRVHVYGTQARRSTSYDVSPWTSYHYTLASYCNQDAAYQTFARAVKASDVLTVSVTAGNDNKYLEDADLSMDCHYLHIARYQNRTGKYADIGAYQMDTQVLPINSPVRGLARAYRTIHKETV